MANSALKFSARINVLGEGLLTDAQVAVKGFTSHHIDAFDQPVDLPLKNIGLANIKGLDVGYFAFLIMPILDAAKAYFYFKKTKTDPKKTNKLTLALHTGKALTTLAGVITLIAGVTLVGFLAMAIANAVLSMRSFVKSAAAFFRGDYPKAGKHFLNFFVSAAITTGFTIAFIGPILFPSVLVAFPALAWGLAVVATGLSALSMIWNGANDNAKAKAKADADAKNRSKQNKPKVVQQITSKIELSKEELAVISNEGKPLKSRAEEIMNAFKEKESVTVKDFLRNKPCQADFETLLKKEIKDFVLGDTTKYNGISPLSLVTDNSETPFYDDTTSAEIDSLLLRNTEGDTDAIQEFYFKQVMDKPLRNLIDEAYLYNPNGTKCGRNTIATYSFVFLNNHTRTAEEELEFMKYKNYSELRKAAVPFASALFTLQDENTPDLTKQENAKLCKNGFISALESAIERYDSAPKSVIIHSPVMITTSPHTSSSSASPNI